MNIILDRVAVWLPQNVDGLLVRKAPPTTAYLTKDSLVYKQATQPLYRYVKNYEVGRGKDRVKFCLFVRSFEKDRKVVEAELDRISAELPKEYVKKELNGATFESFAYTDYYLKDKEAR
jgi:hypothetical protein